MYRRPSEHPPEMKQQNDELAQWVNGMEEARIAEELFQRRTPLVPEDAFYVSQALGNAILGWGTGRYVIDAGTGAGKTTAIMKLLEKIMASCPEYELQDRKRILYLCNRKALREQII